MFGESAQWLSAFKQQLGADKRKSAVLGVLFVVLLVALGSLLVTDATPETANAMATPAVSRGDSGVRAVRPVVEKAGVGKAVPRVGGDVTGRPERETLRRSVAFADLPRTLERNPFDTHAWSKFTPVSARGRGSDGSEGGVGSAATFWRRLGSAVRSRRFERRKELDRLTAELSEIQLQSTMTGSTPMAFISGRLVREGDTIEGFSVVRIRDRRVSVRKYGMVGELVMP